MKVLSTSEEPNPRGFSFTYVVDERPSEDDLKSLWDFDSALFALMLSKGYVQKDGTALVPAHGETYMSPLHGGNFSIVFHVYIKGEVN